MIGALLRIYSYLYHTALALLLAGISVVAIASRSHSLQLGMLPWKGRELTYWLLGVGLAGLLSVFLALIGKLRFLFLLYAIGIFAMMLRGYFLGAYGFSGRDEFRFAVLLTAGGLLAIFGAWSKVRLSSKKSGRSKRR